MPPDASPRAQLALIVTVAGQVKVEDQPVFGVRGGVGIVGDLMAVAGGLHQPGARLDVDHLEPFVRHRLGRRRVHPLAAGDRLDLGSPDGHGLGANQPLAGTEPQKGATTSMVA